MRIRRKAQALFSDEKPPKIGAERRRMLPCERRFLVPIHEMRKKPVQRSEDGTEVKCIDLQ